MSASGPAGAALWAGRRAALATMHGKQAAIAPPLSRIAGLAVEVARGLDTDALGTFTGEIPRAGGLRDTALAKARLGMRAAGSDLGLASEGAYGPHPSIPFLPAGAEVLVLVDDARGLVLWEEIVDSAPVYAATEAASVETLESFLAGIGFPRQAVVVRPNAGAGPVRKGLAARAPLARAVEESAAASADGLARVETDMRAHMNPARMSTIGRLAQRFAERLARACPACGAPGFGRVRAGAALPCAWCGGPTLQPGGDVLGCAACAHEVETAAEGAQEADPAHCPACNP